MNMHMDNVPDDSGSKLNEAKRVPGRLVECSPGFSVCFPPHTAYAVIDKPDYVVVPGSVHHGYGLISWQNLWLPLLNLHSMLHPTGLVVHEEPPRFALVLGYQRAPHAAIEYGAISTVSGPKSILVDNLSQCELPKEFSRWNYLALSCFMHDGQAVPIMDSKQIFSPHLNGDSLSALSEVQVDAP